MEKLVIDRTKWGRGSTGGMLLDPSTGMMCCLGFEALRCGISSSEMSNEPMPRHLARPDFISWMYYLAVDDDGENYMNSADADLAANINDDKSTTDYFKESEITKIFAYHGVEVEFIN